MASLRALAVSPGPRIVAPQQGSKTSATGRITVFRRSQGLWRAVPVAARGAGGRPDPGVAVLQNRREGGASAACSLAAFAAVCQRVAGRAAVNRLERVSALGREKGNW